jgi:hypothetical protein
MSGGLNLKAEEAAQKSVPLGVQGTFYAVLLFILFVVMLCKFSSLYAVMLFVLSLYVRSRVVYVLNERRIQAIL